MKIEGDKIRIFFNNAEDGLVVKGDELTHVTIAGKDRTFVQAHTQIEGANIVVHSPTVDKPVAVRFGWSNTTEPKLCNRAGATCFILQNR